MRKALLWSVICASIVRRRRRRGGAFWGGILETGEEAVCRNEKACSPHCCARRGRLPGGRVHLRLLRGQRLTERRGVEDRVRGLAAGADGRSAPPGLHRAARAR